MEAAEAALKRNFHRIARSALAGMALVAVVVAVYLPLGGHDFILYDDNLYVTSNPMVKAGITREGIAWALSSFHSFNWHPVTWVSHMLDIELFGLDPGKHHLMNLAIHAVNTLLLFLLLRSLTGALWRSAFVAALFALHPLHVESVAWVSERKDLLAAFFGIMAVRSYLAYVRRGGVGAYLGAWLLLALGLMSKAMLVTLPVLLLVLDYWPLGRWRLVSGPAAAPGSSPVRLIAEKAPLFLLSAAAGIAAYLSQKQGGAIFALESFGPGDRLTNAFFSYWLYLGKMVWPSGLSMYYPLSVPALSWVGGGLAGLGLGGLSFAAVRFARRAPYLACGWFWYLVAFLPVIGLIQVGAQAMADRYTYLPLTGVFIVMAWGVADLGNRLRIPGSITPGAGLLIVAVLGGLARRQLGYWQESTTLLSRAVEISPSVAVLRNNLGVALENHGRRYDALVHYQKSVELDPGYVDGWVNLGVAYLALGKAEIAEFHLREALRINPGHAHAHNNYGVLLESWGRIGEARDHYREAVRLDPWLTEAQENLHRIRGGSMPPGR